MQVQQYVPTPYRCSYVLLNVYWGFSISNYLHFLRVRALRWQSSLCRAPVGREPCREVKSNKRKLVDSLELNKAPYLLLCYGSIQIYRCTYVCAKIMLSRLMRASWNLSRLRMISVNACVYYQVRALGGDFLTGDKSCVNPLLQVSWFWVSDFSIFPFILMIFNRSFKNKHLIEIR